MFTMSLYKFIVSDGHSHYLRWGFVIGHSDPSTASVTPEEVWFWGWCRTTQKNDRLILSHKLSFLFEFFKTLNIGIANLFFVEITFIVHD